MTLSTGLLFHTFSFHIAIEDFRCLCVFGLQENKRELNFLFRSLANFHFLSSLVYGVCLLHGIFIN